QLILPAVAPRSMVAAGLLQAAVLIAMAALGAVLRRYARWIAASLLGALIIGLLVDLGTGQRLIQNAWMSYSIIEGARFYGIGNEYAGALLAAALLLPLFIPLAERYPLAAAVIQLLVAVFIGAPSLGANVGGSLLAFAGAVVTGI